MICFNRKAGVVWLFIDGQGIARFDSAFSGLLFTKEGPLFAVSFPCTIVEGYFFDMGVIDGLCETIWKNWRIRAFLFSAKLTKNLKSEPCCGPSGRTQR